MAHLKSETKIHDLSSCLYPPPLNTLKDLAFIKGILYSYFVLSIIVDNKGIKILKIDYL